MTLTIPTPDVTRDRVDVHTVHGEKAREIIYRWNTGQPGDDGRGEQVVLFEVAHSRHAKALVGTLRVVTIDGPITSYTFGFGTERDPAKATTRAVFAEPVARYSAKRLREVAPVWLAALGSQAPEGTAAWHILHRIPAVRDGLVAA